MKKSDKDNWLSLSGAELAAIRQIGHELLLTLVPNNTRKIVKKDSGIVIGGVGAIIVTKKS